MTILLAGAVGALVVIALGIAISRNRGKRGKRPAPTSQRIDLFGRGRE